MVISDDFYPLIHITLKRLIDEKSKRDNVKFTACQLAHALDMPRSIITKLTHSEKTKRVTNPRIDTLIKIVDFFRSDGFNITLEDLIGMKPLSIDIGSQQIDSQSEIASIPIYSFNNKKNESIGTIDIKISKKNKNVFGLYSDRNMEPVFKSGSIFIINPDIPLEHDNLIAMKTSHSQTIEIRKYLFDKNKIVLKSLDNAEKSIILMPTTQCEILGVVIQVNAKT